MAALPPQQQPPTAPVLVAGLVALLAMLAIVYSLWSVIVGPVTDWSYVSFGYLAAFVLMTSHPFQTRQVEQYEPKKK